MSKNDVSLSMPVLLLKTRSAPNDGYEEYFTNAFDRYQPRFVTVLQHTYLPETLDWLRTLLLDGGFSRATPRFNGMIFTSQRAVDAFTTVVAGLRGEGHDIGKYIPTNVPLFVVGPATANGVRAVGLGCPVLGQESGNGEALAEFMLDHFRRAGVESGSLLFLVGEQRRDIIPNKLQDSNLPVNERIEVVEKVVYGTRERQEFSAEFKGILDEVSGHITSEILWVVVFSPTGCAAMLRTLGWVDGEGRFDKAAAASRHANVRVATIGPTTRDFLKASFAFSPHVCASSPSPDGVGSGIIEYMKTHQ